MIDVWYIPSGYGRRSAKSSLCALSHVIALGRSQLGPMTYPLGG